MPTPKGQTLRKYTEYEVRRGLAEVAICTGNTALASKRLKDQGISIPKSTLTLWTTSTQLERYQEIQRELVPRIHGQIASECEALAAEEGKLERELIERVRETMPELSGRDAHGAMRNAAVSKAVNIDKANLLRGKPTAIVEHRSADELLRSLAKVPGLIVDGTAEEIKDAQTLEPPAE